MAVGCAVRAPVVARADAEQRRTKRRVDSSKRRVRVADFAQPLERLRNVVEESCASHVVACEERDRMAFVTDSDAAISSNARMTGRERMTRLNWALDAFGLTRSKNQRHFHRNMLMAIIRKVFKDDFAENIDFLRELFQVDRFKSEVMIVTPRRWGKTFAVAMFVAACAYALESTTQAIFSTGRRASKKLLDLVYQFLCKLPGMKERIMVKNVEEIRIQGPGGPDDVRTICSYPSKVRFRVRVCVRVRLVCNRRAATATAGMRSIPADISERAILVRTKVLWSTATTTTMARNEQGELLLPYEELIESMLDTQQCLLCGSLFTEYDSMGRLLCRYHPGTYQGHATTFGGALDTYTCCGVSPHTWSRHYAGYDEAVGCVRCDHSSTGAVPEMRRMTADNMHLVFGDDVRDRHFTVDPSTRLVTIHRRLVADR